MIRFLLLVLFILFPAFHSRIQAEVSFQHAFNDKLLKSNEFEIKLPTANATVAEDGIHYEWVEQKQPFEASHFRTLFALIGDFDVLFRFRVIRIGTPDRGYGAGVLVRIEFDDSILSGVSIQRQARTNGDQVISIDETKHVQADHKVQSIPIDELGECYGFRVQRKGRVLDVYSINESGQEKLAWNTSVSTAPALPLAFYLHSGDAVADLDVVFESFMIQADGFTTSHEYRKQRGGTQRLLAITGIGLLVFGLIRRLKMR